MPKTIGVERLPRHWDSTSYDLGIAVAGYEQRSRHLFEMVTLKIKAKHAAGFIEQQVLEFESNIEWFRDNGFLVEVVTDDAYKTWFEARLFEVARDGKSLRVVIDISSLSRVRIAHLLTVLRGLPTHEEIIVDFVYSLANFTPPTPERSPNTHVGPVTDQYAGWWSEPDRSLSVVVGLGYEQDKALGAVEYLQAHDIWVFEPVSVIGEYSEALQKANGTLLKAVAPSNQLIYRVQDPFDCFARLSSLTHGLTLNSNVVLLPFGPKLFVLCSLLVSCQDDQVAVWRVSAQDAEKPINRIGSGYRYGLRVTFSTSAA